MTTPTNKPTTKSGDNGQKSSAAASAAAANVKSAADDLTDTVVSEAERYAEQAKGTAADEVKSVSSALRTAANELRSGSAQQRTFSQIADGLANASETMRDKDMGEMVGDLNRFARKNPVLFLGSAALIGLAATRFAKASDSTDTHASVASGKSRRSPTAGNTRTASKPATGPATSSPKTGEWT